jgi:hypothetical membrane protein
MVGGGKVPSTPLPCISDLWTQAPGNWISRWGVVSGSTLWAASSYLAWWCFPAPISGEKQVHAALSAIAILAAVALAVVGCVNEDENDAVHTTAAIGAFALYDVYMAAILLTPAVGACGSAARRTTRK